MPAPAAIENDRTVRAPDGTAIAYAKAGSGPPLVLTNGLTTTSFFWKYLRPLWLEHHTVITWDLPGHGRSEPARSPASAEIAGQPPILARVMDAAGVAHATQIGWSVGCQVVLEMYRQYPERCDALVALFGPAETALTNTRLPLSGPRLYALLKHRSGIAFARLVQQLARAGALPGGPGLLRRSGLVGGQTSDSDLRALIADLRRVHPATGRLMACSAQRHSAFDVLAQLKVPLLIMAGGKDLFAPPRRVGEPVHRAAPGSVYVRLPEATHTALLDHPAQIARTVDQFLATPPGPAATRRAD